MKNHFTKVFKKQTKILKKDKSLVKMKTDLSKDFVQNITSEGIKDVNLKTKQANCMSENGVTENTAILKEISDIKKPSLKDCKIQFNLKDLRKSVKREEKMLLLKS